MNRNALGLNAVDREMNVIFNEVKSLGNNVVL